MNVLQLLYGIWQKVQRYFYVKRVGQAVDQVKPGQTEKEDLDDLEDVSRAVYDEKAQAEPEAKQPAAQAPADAPPVPPPAPVPSVPPAAPEPHLGGGDL